MRQGSTIMDAEVPVKISDSDREARHSSLLFHLGEADRLEAKKAADSKANQKLIDAEWAECYHLRRVLLDDQENRKRGDIRFGEEAASIHRKHGFTSAIPDDTEIEIENADECFDCELPEGDPIHAVEAATEDELGGEAG